MRFECKDIDADGICRLLFRGKPCKKEDCSRYLQCFVCMWKIKNECRRDIDLEITCKQKERK